MTFQTKILLIEEEGKFENNLTPKLEQEGFSVLTVENNFQAFRYMNNVDCHLQLILAPLSKNDGNNLALLDKVQGLEKNKYMKLPIIFFSSEERLGNLFSLSNYGYCDYIKEPFNFNELMLKIKTNLYLNTRKSPSVYHKYNHIFDDECEIFNNIYSTIITLTNKLEEQGLSLKFSRNINRLLLKLENILEAITNCYYKDISKKLSQIDLIAYMTKKLNSINFKYYEYKTDRISNKILTEKKYFLSAIDEVLNIFLTYSSHFNPIRFYEFVNDEWYVIKIISFGFNIYKIKNELDYISKIFALNSCQLKTTFSKEGIQMQIFIPAFRLNSNEFKKK